MVTTLPELTTGIHPNFRFRGSEVLLEPRLEPRPEVSLGRDQGKIHNIAQPLVPENRGKFDRQHREQLLNFPVADLDCADGRGIRKVVRRKLFPVIRVLRKEPHQCLRLRRFNLSFDAHFKSATTLLRTPKKVFSRLENYLLRIHRVVDQYQPFIKYLGAGALEKKYSTRQRRQKREMTHIPLRLIFMGYPPIPPLSLLSEGGRHPIPRSPAYLHDLALYEKGCTLTYPSFTFLLRRIIYLLLHTLPYTSYSRRAGATLPKLPHIRLNNRLRLGWYIGQDQFKRMLSTIVRLNGRRARARIKYAGIDHLSSPATPINFTDGNIG